MEGHGYEAVTGVLSSPLHFQRKIQSTFSNSSRIKSERERANKGMARQDLLISISAYPISLLHTSSSYFLSYSRFDGQSKWRSSILSKIPSIKSGSIPSEKKYPPSQDWSEQLWSLRRHLIADTALFNSWDIFAFQEVLHGQLLDLSSLLGSEYSHVGVGRNDGQTKGEAVPVFYKSSKFELVSEKDGGVGKEGVVHFWLSPTPDKVASVGWDADQTRMCTHLALKLKRDETEQVIHIFSTHYDHKGMVAREKSSELIVRKAQEVVDNGKKLVQDRKKQVEPLVVLIGDLNSPRNEMGWQVSRRLSCRGVAALARTDEFPSSLLRTSSLESTVYHLDHLDQLSPSSMQVFPCHLALPLPISPQRVHFSSSPPPLQATTTPSQLTNRLESHPKEFGRNFNNLIGSRRQLSRLKKRNEQVGS